MGRYELIVRSGFSATHQVRMPDGNLEPAHEHSFKVEVFLEGDGLDGSGMVVDFTTLQRNLGQITTLLRGTHLNDLPAFAAGTPSTELMARHIYDRYQPTLPPRVRLTRVRVWETEDCAAAFVP